MNAIVYGGGWKQHREHHIKFKAWSCLLLAILASGCALDFAEDIGRWIFSLPAILWMASVVFFCRERPSSFYGSPDADHDPRKLYSKQSS